LRKQIAAGARTALEEQYLDVLERTIQARPLDACLGGDPSIANRVRAFLLVRYYRGGAWQDRIEVGWNNFSLSTADNSGSWSRLSPSGPSYSI
jgi:Nup93/Nic96